jgi:CubicO group peptidase (beta-lactamase class C family)
MKIIYAFLTRAIACIVFSITLILACSCQSHDPGNFNYYGIATSSKPQEGIFFKNWILSGPIELKDTAQYEVADSIVKKAFDVDLITSVHVEKGKSISPLQFNGKDFPWKEYSSPTDIIDLQKTLGEKNFVICYALSEIISDANQKLLMGLGSDDAVKVWINGKVVHKNYTARAVTPDEDLFEINLNKGSNQVLIKIENQRLGYGFSVRPLGKDAIEDLMIQKAGIGDFEAIKLLMKYAPDLKKENNLGLTAWQVATLKGRTTLADFLATNGAVKNTNFPPLNVYIDKMMSDYNGKDSVPGIAVLVAKDGKILQEKGFGNADIEHHMKVAPDTKFRIGSISKQFTASAILRLQEQGKINVNDKLSKYFPDFPRGNEVSIYQLLTHTSGLYSYTDNDSFIDSVTKPVSDAALLNLIESGGFNFNPGEHLQYCNSGYVLLGQIVGRISGKSYSDYITDEFFKPLGMTNSGIYNNANKPTNEAIGYAIENGKIVKATDWDMTWGGGAGAIYSTVEDLFKWDEALFNGKVLNDKSMKMAFSQALLKNGKPAPEMPYGLGWMLPEYRGIKFIAHGGGLDGFLTFLSRQPEEKLTIIVLTNCTPPFLNFNPTAISSELAEYVLWQKMTPQAEYTTDTSLTSSQLEKYTGRYDYGQGAILTVTREGNQLFAQMSGQQSFEIFYMGNDEFFWKIVEAHIKFITNEQGEVTGAIHFQGGQQLNVTKLAPQAAQQQMNTITPAQLAKLTGQYDYGRGMILTIRQEGEHLYAQMSGQQEFEIFFEGNDEFSWQVVNARIKFVKNEQGEVTGAIHYQGGQKMNVKKL